MTLIDYFLLAILLLNILFSIKLHCEALNLKRRLRVSNGIRRRAIRVLQKEKFKRKNIYSRKPNIFENLPNGAWFNFYDKDTLYVKDGYRHFREHASFEKITIKPTENILELVVSK